jgi:two-component system NarL family sensor kinase
MRALRRSNRETLLRLATLVRDSNDAVIIRDLKDRIIAWNKGAQRMYGYAEAEALGMSIRRLVPKSERSRTPEFARNAAPVEVRRRTKNGRILDVLLTVTVLHDETGAPVELATTERNVTDFKRGERELRRLHARVISAQETERKRLGRELHDGVGQILSGVKFRLEALAGESALSPRAEARIRQVDGFLARAVAEIRRVSQNLMPSELEDLGLEAALLSLCREFKGRARVEMTVSSGRAPEAVSPEVALAFFRIAQEALNNIGKHSKATSASIALTREGREIVMGASDNGVGFALGGRPSSGRGIGLGNMRERATAVGGSITIRSSPGGGTSLVVRAPLAGLGREAE